MPGIGSDALSASWDTLEDGGTVTIRTDGTYDFGDEGPTLLFRQTFKNVDDGGDVPADNEGVGDVTQATGLVEDTPDLPYGKGQVVDPGTGRYRVSYPERADEFYEHYYIQWPDSHQDAAEETLRNLEGAGWQVKGIWHFLGGGGYGSPDANDLFSGSPLLDVDEGELNAWTDGYKIASNSIPTSTTDRSSSGLNGSKPLRWRSEPISKQFWVKCGPENGEAAGSDGMLRNTSVEDGEVAYADYEDAGEFTDKRADQTGFDRFTCPGYTRGFDYEEGWHPYFSDIYHTVGPGAAARIEVTDSDTYRESNRLTVFTVESWSATDVQAEVVEGIFHDDTLEGNHLWLTDADNESRYVGQLDGEFDRPSLSVPNETIPRGGSATLSPAAEAIDTVTIDQLWTDWTVTVPDPDGATTDDRVSETGEFELSWDGVQSQVSPSITVEPPGDTYIGGIYALEVIAERENGSTTETALIDVQDSQEGD